MHELRKVVVLGANGTMGSGAAALFAGSGFEVAMLARGIDKAHQGLAKAKQAVRSDVLGKHIRCGSYEADLEAEVAGADLIFECVSEDMAVKEPFFEQIDRVRKKGSIVATVSSGLSIARMCEGRSDDFRRNFLGLHLFNPPHVITGTEVIAGPDTDHGMFAEVTAMLRRRLGRTVIECKDLPAFAGNRVGFKVLNECAILAEEHGVPIVDYLIGPYTGRAMAPLATIDLVGWDVHQAIVDNVYANTKDEAHSAFAMPAYMRALMKGGHLGDKTPLEGGFYRRWTSEGVKVTSCLFPQKREYSEREAPRAPKLPWIAEIQELHLVGRYRDAMQKFLKAEGEEATIARRVIVGYVSYALNRVGSSEVVKSASDVDQIMGFGFNWAP
ncbi:MAG TPA: 3-hydroxyacyl-CoA dehydrogenase family protein, partial [Polyangiaceae bacterium]